MQKPMQKLPFLFDSLVYWGIFILLIFIPLYLKFPLFGVSGTFVSIRLEDILIAVIYLFWLVKILLQKDLKNQFKDKLNQTLLLFFFIGAVSSFSALYLTRTTQLSLVLLHFLRRIEFIGLLPVVISTIKTRGQIYSLLIVSLIVIFITNFYALGQRYLHFPAVSTTTSELSKGQVYYLSAADRVSSTFAGHYDLAVYLMMAVTITVPLIFYFGKVKGLKTIFEKKRLITVVSLTFISIVSFIVLVMTATRFSFLAVIFGVLTSFVVIGNKKVILLVIAIATLTLIYPSQLRDRFVSTFKVNIQKSFGGFSAVTDEQKSRSMLNIPTLPNSKFVESPMETTGTSENPDITPGEPTDSTDLGVFRSLDIRLQVEWPRALRALMKNPFLGTGYSSIGLATDNDFLRSFGEVGILGTLAFMLILAEAGKRVRRVIRNNEGFLKYLGIGVFSMFLAFIINSLFIDVFEASKIAILFWVIIGITLSAQNISKNEKTTI